jgi:Trypsin-like peptidase domain/Colicin V production protein
VNVFDAIAALVLVAAVLAGARTGALPQIGGIGGAVAGLLVVLNLASWLVTATLTLEPIPRALVVLGALIGAVVVGEALGSAFGRVVASRLGAGVLSGLDRLAGGLLGAAQAVLIVWLAGGLLAVGPFPTLGRAAAESFSLQVLEAFLPRPADVVGQIAGVLDSSGLPSVFIGLEPAPLQAVDTPTTPQARAIAAAAAASTARIVSIACTTQVTGTGEIIARGYLVTNAHVVAGAGSITVQLGNQQVTATAVAFDPQLDVALLYAPGLRGNALRFAAIDPGRGAVGAAIGYAGGGPMVIIPAGVAGAYEATGRDIYGRSQIQRQILELRASIQPGDSGGPLILADGTIGGLVFAESRTDLGVGYALTPTAVAVRIAPAIGRTAAVDTGACIH